jgi:thiamine biosynthesis lipoprotein
MGSRFDITVVAEDSIVGNGYIQDAINEISRIENLISEWDSTTQTSAIIKEAGIVPVKVDKELFDLIQRSLVYSKLSDGAFDITFAGLGGIWKFDGSVKTLPDSALIQEKLSLIGYDKIILNPSDTTVFLSVKGMRIGFGAIGKGYAADKTKALLQQKGVSAGIINASGDLITWGKQPNGDSWTVAITNPFNKEKAFGILPLDNWAVATSGNYEKYLEFNGIRYAHIIDPRTGYPTKGIVSVTVFAASAEMCDALATAVFVLGAEVGIDRINQLQGVSCIVVTDKGELLSSKNINIADYEK